VKIIPHLIKCLPPTEYDEQNSNIENQHGTEHHCSAGSFQNKKFPNSNDTDSLQDNHELAFKDRLLTFSAKKIQSLEIW
jgi:hypothetical protein